MKLEKVLDKMNFFEKISLIRIIESITSVRVKDDKLLKNLLDGFDDNLKHAEHYYIAKILNLIEEDYKEHILNELTNTGSHLDIVIDIFIRDGNCIISHDWFSQLYDKEIRNITKKINDMKIFINKETNKENKRVRDYRIYQDCVKTAYFNDKTNNCTPKITSDEQSILSTLIYNLELSQEEVRLINYTIIPIKKRNIDDLIKELKNAGIILFSKKENNIYIPDEIVKILRDVRGKEIPDKHFLKVLKHLTDSQINTIARKHNIDYKLSREEKISSIINEGIPFSVVLQSSVFKKEVNISDVKIFLNDLIENKMKINLPSKGITVKDKIRNLIAYFEQIDKDEKVSTSIDGYENMLNDINTILPNFNDVVKREFELQDEFVLRSEYLLDYNLKPRDLLYLLKNEEIKKFCRSQNISTRRDMVENIIKAYKNTDNIYLENYEYIAKRDLQSLKENGIQIKDSELGVKFEYLTKKIFSEMGFNVDEKLRRQINSKQYKIDIILNLGNKELIILECKSLKDKDLYKYSSVRNQLKSYIELANKKEYKVIKTLVVAPEFSDYFQNECAIEYNINVSLITAESLINIYNEFKKSKLNHFPYKLLLKDVVINEERIIKAING